VSGYITAPSLPKPLAVLGGAASILGSALLINDVIGRAGGYQWRDNQLAKIGGGNISRSIPNTNPSSGQQTGVTFYLVFNRTGGDRPSQTILIAQNNTRTAGASVQEALAQHQINGSVGFTAPVSGVLSDTITSPQALTPNRVFTVGTGNGTVTVSLPDNSGFSATGASYQKFNYSFGGAIRIDGQPETGAPDQKLPPIPFGYTPTNSPFKNDQDRKVGTPPPLQASRANGLPGALGLGGAVPTQALSPSPVKPANPNPNPNPSVSPPFAPSPNKPPLPNPVPEKGKEKTVPPINPSDNRPPDLRQELTRLGAILALILGATAFDNLKNAAKTGSCETLKSPSCTKDMEDRIKNPVNANVDAKTAALAANQAGQDIALGNIIATQVTHTGFFNKILSVLNNTVIDRTLAVMNLATNVHNAAMLTRDIGETLGSVVDNVINLSGLKFTNSEGSQVQFTDFIGANFRAFMISVLGAENYVSLVLQWQKANTVYHATMGVINTTQSMLDPISSAVEYGMENVSKIGNSLKEDGVVSENAYPAMNETIRARRVNRFERLNDTLEGAENIASNLSSVTSSAVSIKEDYEQLREDYKEWRDKANAFNTADLEARAALKSRLPTNITPINLVPAPAEEEEP
jgi:hypothetical protein